MNRPGLRLVLWASALVLTGCPKKPLDFGPRGEITDPAELLRVLKERSTDVRAVQGEAKASIDTKDGGGSLDQFIVAEAPDRLRIESISFFGSPVAVLVSDGQEARLWDIEHNRFYAGPATAGMVSRLLPFTVEPEHLVELLLGRVPLLEGAEPKSLEVDAEAGLYVLTLQSGADVQRVGVDPKTLRPAWTELAGWLAKFDEWHEQTGLPRKQTIETKNAKVELSWREREINPDLEPEIFTLEPGEGVEVLRVSP